MKSDKHFLVLGSDAFGAALARRLTANECRVTGVDRRELRVDELKDELYEAVVADATDREALAELHPENTGCVVISLGRTVLENVIDAGFPGPVYSVNPKYKKVYVRASRLPTGPRGFA